MIKDIPWSCPDIGEEEINAVQHVMKSGWVTYGLQTALFEKELAEYIGCRYVVVTNNGTSALMAALMAHKVRRAFIPVYSYFTTSNVAKLLNLNTEFYKIDRETIQMRNPHLRYSVPISFAGMPLDKEEWDNPEDIIEDASESFGAESRGIKTGNQGWTATFSFHAAKLITTVEGGAIATNNTKIYENLVSIRSKVLNFKPTDIGCAIGRVQLKKVGQYLKNRDAVAKYYRESLKGLVAFQEIPAHVTQHANMMFPIFVNEPEKLANKLKENKIETRLGWVPVISDDTAINVYKSIIALPIYNKMSILEAEVVSECVKKYL